MAAAAAARILGKGSLAAALSIGTVSVWKQPETQCERPQTLRNRMTAIGRFSLLSETEFNPSIITLFMTLSGPLLVNDLKRVWDDKKIGENHPRFHQVISETHEGYFETKIVDEQQDPLDDHVSETIYPTNRLDIVNRIRLMQVETWDLSQKLWHVTLAYGKPKVKANITDTSPDETMLFFRSHHALGDGSSLGSVIMELCDEDFRQAIVDFLKERKRKAGNLWQQLYKTWLKFLWFVTGSFKAAWYQSRLFWYNLSDSNPWNMLAAAAVDSEKGLSHRTISYTSAAPVEQVKWVAQQLGKATINDVFCACVTAAMARMLEYHREKRAALEQDALPQQKYMNLALPVHLKGGVVLPGESVGNRIGAMVVRLPGEGSLSSEERLERTHRELLKVKQTPAALLSHLMARALSASSVVLPARFTAWIFSKANAGACCVVTNTKGPPQHVHIDGHRVESMYGFIPLPPGIPVGVVVGSYAGQMKLTLSAEPWAVPDGDIFLSWVLEEYLKLLEAAKQKQSNQSTQVV